VFTEQRHVGFGLRELAGIVQVNRDVTGLEGTAALLG